MEIAKQAKNDALEFVTKLGGVVVWISLTLVGAHSIYLGFGRVPELSSMGLRMGGALNIIVGLFVLYTALMFKGKQHGGFKKGAK